MNVRSRAAEELGLPADASAEGATSTFLARLPRADWAPDGDAVAAVNTIAGLAVPANAESEPSLRDAVEEFVSRYWSLPPAERLAAWLALTTRSPDDAVADRLLALQAGLDVTVTPLVDPAEDQIATLVRHLYLLLPRARAIRRNQWLLDRVSRHRDDVAAAGSLQKHQPGLAALEPVLFSRLTPLQFDAAAFAAAATEDPIVVPSILPPRAHDFEGLTFPRTRPRIRPPEPASKGSGVGHVVWIAAVVLSIIVKGLSSLSHTSSTSNPAYTPPRIHYNNTNKKQNATQPEQSPFGTTPFPESSFSELEVSMCKLYELERDEHPFTQKSKPPYFDEWVRLGKPEAGVLVRRFRSP